MINNIKIEICAGCIDDVITASKYNVDRIELNSALELGGLTPSLNTLLETKKITNIPIMCMVRNRMAGFCYSQETIDVMFKDAKLMIESGADGIVFGFLNKDLTIDAMLTDKMVKLIHSYNKEAIFHKAFDKAKDMDASINCLIELKVDRVLTDGLSDGDILKGINNLKYLNDKYGGQIEILPCGGIRSENVVEALNKTGIRQFHTSCKNKYLDIEEYLKVDPNELNKLINALNKNEIIY